MSLEFIDVPKGEKKLYKYDSEALNRAIKEVQSEMTLLTTFSRLTDIEKLAFARNMRGIPDVQNRTNHAIANGIDAVIDFNGLKNYCGFDAKKKFLLF